MAEGVKKEVGICQIFLNKFLEAAADTYTNIPVAGI
jgi:hypothetical protein